MGSDQQFCLRWNNFQSSLLASLPQLLDADDLTDVTLSAGGRNIRAHRVVLSACSQYFKDLFREMQSFQHPVIVLPQTTFSDLCSLVTFMYSGEVNIYQDQLAGLLSTADVLHIRGLAEVPHANGTPLKKKIKEENLHQDSIASTQSFHRKKITCLPPSTNVNESPHPTAGKMNRLDKTGKPVPGKKRAFERDEPEEAEPPFVQVKVEQGVEGIDLEPPIPHIRKPYLHHPAQALHPVQPMLPEKQCRTPQGGDSFSLPHPVEDAVGMEGEIGYPEGNQVPMSTDATLQGQSSSEDSGGGGNGSGGGNNAEMEHQNLGQGPVYKGGGSTNSGNSSSNSMIIIPSNQIPSSRRSVNCPVCGRLISQKRNLKQHMKTHLNHMDVGMDKNRMKLADGSPSAWIGESPNLCPIPSLPYVTTSETDSFTGGHDVSQNREWYIIDREKRGVGMEGQSAANMVGLPVLGNEVSHGVGEDAGSEHCDVREQQQWFTISEKRENELRNVSNVLAPDDWMLQKEMCPPSRENLDVEVAGGEKGNILMSALTLPSDSI